MIADDSCLVRLDAAHSGPKAEPRASPSQGQSTGPCSALGASDSSRQGKKEGSISGSFRRGRTKGHRFFKRPPPPPDVNNSGTGEEQLVAVSGSWGRSQQDSSVLNNSLFQRLRHRIPPLTKPAVGTPPDWPAKPRTFSLPGILARAVGGLRGASARRTAGSASLERSAASTLLERVGTKEGSEGEALAERLEQEEESEGIRDTVRESENLSAVDGESEIVQELNSQHWEGDREAEEEHSPSVEVSIGGSSTEGSPDPRPIGGEHQSLQPNRESTLSDGTLGKAQTSTSPLMASFGAKQSVATPTHSEHAPGPGTESASPSEPVPRPRVVATYSVYDSEQLFPYKELLSGNGTVGSTSQGSASVQGGSAQEGVKSLELAGVGVPRLASQQAQAPEGSGSEVKERGDRRPLSAVVKQCNKEWFEETRGSAQDGDVSMQILLGQMLLVGYGTAKDTKEALYWLEKAADRDEDAKALLESVREKDRKKTEKTRSTSKGSVNLNSI